MTSLQSLVEPTYLGLAHAVEVGGPALWEGRSLCEGWLVSHVVAHVTMPARLSHEQFSAELAAAEGDFTTLSNTVASRDAALPVGDLLGQLRSAALHAWQPPGGGEGAALLHAVIHSVDVTVAQDLPVVAPPEAVTAALDLLTGSGGTWFDVGLDGVRLEATDAPWQWGAGRLIRADAGSLVALLSGRSLGDGMSLRPRAGKDG